MCVCFATFTMNVFFVINTDLMRQTALFTQNKKEIQKKIYFGTFLKISNSSVKWEFVIISPLTTIYDKIMLSMTKEKMSMPFKVVNISTDAASLSVSQ